MGSTVELSKDAIKMPVWIVGILGTLFLGWNGFITLKLLETNERLIRLQAHVEADIVTPGVQRELQNVRDRINLDTETRNLLLKTSIENQRDIENIKEQLKARS